MSDNEIEDVSFLPGESLHRKARYEPNILQKWRLLLCNKARLTVIGVVAAVFILVIILVAVITRSQCKCSQGSPFSESPTESPKTDQDCIATNGEKFPYQNILLPKAIIPETYQIFMHPNISESIFRGTVNIICSVDKVTDFIVFHIKDLNITHLTVKDLESGTQIATAHLECKTNEQVYVQLGSKLAVAKSSIQINVEFVGAFTDKLSGFYKSMYKTKSGDKRYIATTHFEPTDARAAFPCFDEPALKATFQLTMIRDKNMISLFNMPLERTMPFDKDTSLMKDVFQKSVKMSTYLVAFVVCDYASLKNHTKRNTTVGVYAPHDAIDTAKFALDSAVKVLDYYENFFDVEYPLPKQDLIAIPDFAAGAMENWGLITYRMTAILYDPKVSSTKNQQWVAVVVAHELAHQWFGNLVTMAWWDDLWLNEGFASYVEYIGSGIVNADWHMQEQFVIDSLLEALYLDSLSNSHPVSVPVHNPNQINEIFDAISYSKGSSIIRMLKNYLGEDVFKKGLSGYLKKYKYRNAATDDLWNSFSGAVQASGAGTQLTTDVGSLMDTWTKQMGYPVITLHREGNRVTATQTRFLLYSKTNISKEFKSPYGYHDLYARNCHIFSAQDEFQSQKYVTLIWDNLRICNIPMANSIYVQSFVRTPKGEKDAYYKGFRYGESFKGETFEIPQPTNWIKGNAGMFGYYRVNYDKDNWVALTSQLNTNHLVFSASERAGLIDDAFMLARAGLLNQTVALELSLYMVNERDYLPWRTLLDNLGYIESRIETKPAYSDYKKYLLKLTKNQLDATTWEDTGKPLENATLNNSHPWDGFKLDGIKVAVLRRYLRSAVLGKAVELGHQSSVQKGQELFKQWQSDHSSISPNLKTVIYHAGIKYGSDQDWEMMWDDYLKETDASEKRKLMSALGMTRDSNLLARYLNYGLNDTKVRSQDTSTVVNSVASNPGGQVLSWRFFQQHWDTFHKRYASLSFILSGLIKSVAGRFDTQFDYDEVKTFFTKRDAGSGKRAIQQVLEKIQMNIDWLNTHEQEVTGWLKK